MKKDTKEKYISRHYKAAFQYEEDILSGKVIAGKHIKNAINRRKELHKKYFYSEEAVKKVLAFFYYVNLNQGGKPKQFNPASWQVWVTMNMFGYFRDKACEKRLFKDVLIFVARKSGKTSLGAIFALYSLIKEERSAESYVLATTQNQATQALRYAKEIVRDSPALKRRIKIMQYQLRTEENGTGIFKALTSDAETLDGLNPSFTIVDEAHAHSTKDLYNIIKTGTLARANPLIITISTAGFDKTYPFYNDVKIGRSVVAGEMEDDSTFYALYELDDESEFDNTDMWIKSNPSIGVTIDLEDMIIAYKKASLTLSDLINFKVKNLNIYSDGATTWIPDSDYHKCFKESKVKEFKGAKAYLGIDLSATRDLAALSVVIENPENGMIETETEFFFPTKDNDNNKIRKSGIDLSSWVDDGWIQAHDNKIIDYDEVYKRIKYYVDSYEVQVLTYDPWGAQILMSELESKLFIDLMPAKQNTAFFNFPMKYVERLVYSEQINFTKNPVLRWNFRNVVIYTDANGYIKPVKNKSLDSIDGLISLVVALGGYIRVNYESVAMIMDEYNEQTNNEEEF